MSTEDTWRSQVIDGLEKRDLAEKSNIQMFASFEALYERVVQSEDTLAKLKSTDAQEELESTLRENQKLKEQLKESQEQVRELESKVFKQKSDITNSSKEVTMLKKAVTRLTNKLNNQTEEYQHKNKSIELINDEILSLTIQNNLLTDKAVELKKENLALVERWIQKVKSDADKMNETNAFLELHNSKNI